MKLNIKLLRKIQKHISEEPLRFFMEWAIARKEGNEEGFASDNSTYQKFAPCGTAACIAGWANILTKGENPSDFRRARLKLGLDPRLDLSYNYVFDVPGWPEQFRKLYERAKTPKTRAYLIETGK